jgi:hypothetical protein
MSQAAAAAQIAATAISVGSSIAQGAAQAKAAKSEAQSTQAAGQFQATQLRQRAGQERASAQRAAIEERRRGRLARSRARNLAGASGAGADDPTVVGIFGDLAGEGEYNALSQLYSGEEAAKGLELDADVAESEADMLSSAALYRGKAARRAGYIDSAGTVLSSGSSLFDKYGDDWFKTDDAANDSSWLQNYNLDRAY